MYNKFKDFTKIIIMMLIVDLIMYFMVMGVASLLAGTHIFYILLNPDNMAFRVIVFIILSIITIIMTCMMEEDLQEQSKLRN